MKGKHIVKKKVVDENGKITKDGLKKINKLINQAFGIGSRGDLDYSPGFDAGLEKTGQFPSLGDFPRLKYISTGAPLFCGYTAIGKFTACDGSRLIIKPKYEEKAKKYATFYQKKFDKSVKITTSENL